VRVIGIRFAVARLADEETDFDCGELGNSDEAVDQQIPEHEIRERFVAQGELELTHHAAAPDELFPIIDGQLAAFGLEVVQFDDGSDDLMWRIEKRRS